MENKAELALKFDKLTILILGIFLFLFPVIVTTVNTDAFVVPKQAFILIVVIIGLVILGIKGILIRTVRLRRTPFDLPLIIFALAGLLSAIFAVNKADSFISLVPLILTILIYFIITNNAKRAQDVMFLSASLIGGSILVSAITLLSYLKIYLLPSSPTFAFTRVQTFTPLGSLFEQSIYLILVLSFCLYMAWPALKKRGIEKGRLIFAAGALFLLIGVAVTILGTMTLQKPTILPYQTGFQIAFAAISQDNGRVVEGFLMGSGIGTFITDFTRFKPAALNLNASLWNLSFLRSSSFILELIATTGVLGILSFIFLSYRILRTKPLFPPLILILIFSIILPFSFSTMLLLFVLLGIYSASQGLTERQKTRFFDVDLSLVALKRGVFALSDPGKKESESNILPYGFLVLIISFCLLLGIPSVKFLISDYLFQKSLIAAANNNAQETYQLQKDAINMFPQRDGYHRIFSQVNLSIANNLASSVPKDSKPSTQTQQTIYQLIQQSINSARTATTVAPGSSINWQNLSSIYRSLIGFGQNADTFAIIANQQALALDPNNPQQYINYGGIFYQLGQWDNAIRQFQIAANLKPDFANAFYNLGHGLEQKGDLQGALTQYQTVKSLTANDKPSLTQINGEIAALQAKIGKKGTETQGQATTNQPPIEVNQPAAKLPAQNPPVKIPAPKEASPTPTKGPSPTPTSIPLQ